MVATTFLALRVSDLLLLILCLEIIIISDHIDAHMGMWIHSLLVRDVGICLICCVAHGRLFICNTLKMAQSEAETYVLL